MESTSKTMSALRTKSNANNTSEMLIGIVTEIGTQEISAKAEFNLTRDVRHRQIGGDMPILSDKLIRIRSFPYNRENENDLLSR